MDYERGDEVVDRRQHPIERSFGSQPEGGKELLCYDLQHLLLSSRAPALGYVERLCLKRRSIYVCVCIFLDPVEITMASASSLCSARESLATLGHTHTLDGSPDPSRVV